jgi:ribosome-binding protein aMBF1 (putative translation factor)
MNSQKHPEELKQGFRDIVRLRNDQEKLEFEAEMIHLQVMDQIRTLMEEQGMNKTMLAKHLNTTKGYVSQLFSGDKLLNLKLLAKFQRIFQIQFEILPRKTVEEESKAQFLGVEKVTPDMWSDPPRLSDQHPSHSSLKKLIKTSL